MKFSDFILVAAHVTIFLLSLMVLVPNGNWIALGFLALSSGALGAIVLDSLNNR